VLSTSAVPSVFDWTSTKPKRKPPDTATTESEEVPVPSTSTAGDVTDVEESFPSVPAGDHDYSVQRQPLEEQLQAAQQRIKDLETELAEASTLSTFGLHRFSSNPAMIKFYTGFISYDCLVFFYRSIASEAAAMKTWSQMQRGSATLQRSFGAKLQLIDQFFLFLHKLRVGSLDQDLADKFGVSVATVSRIVITWANFLYVILGSQTIWPSRTQIKRYMPLAFRQLYPDTRVVIDCTEIAIQCPSSMVLRSEFYSAYKGRTTLKCLIGVTPSGAVSFISSLFAGSISDKHITKVSGLLDLLEPGDVVMADKGFLIADLLSPLNCSLVMPHFLSQKKQFSHFEAQQNKIVSHLRVHVERANRRFKEYHLFDSPISLSLSGSVNQLWCVACLLSNFQGPLIVKAGQ